MNSFDTISAVGANAAVIHYRPTNATDTPITRSNIYLLDSGGQYLSVQACVHVNDVIKAFACLYMVAIVVEQFDMSLVYRYLMYECTIVFVLVAMAQPMSQEHSILEIQQPQKLYVRSYMEL